MACAQTEQPVPCVAQKQHNLPWDATQMVWISTISHQFPQTPFIYRDKQKQA